MVPIHLSVDRSQADRQKEGWMDGRMNEQIDR